MVQLRTQLLPGTRVGDHLIVCSVLGEGGTATVYEALHTRLGAKVALKVLDKDPYLSEGSRARLKREAHVCASIEDPHVPEIYDVGELDDGTPYVVMERVVGPTLESLLDRGPLRLELALNIARDLLSALSAIHRAEVVHRDIKPGNLIVQVGTDDSVRVRLMDFGLSKRLVASHYNPMITRPGTAVGTPHYMAPEQISGRPVDGRVDVYAAGVLLYEMLSGHRPFDGENLAELVSSVLVHEYVPLRKRASCVPTWLEAVVDRAMAAQPEDRYHCAAAMRDALDARHAAHVSRPPSGPRSSLHPQTLLERGVHRPVVATGVGAALAFGAIVWVQLGFRDAGGPAPPSLPPSPHVDLGDLARPPSDAVISSSAKQAALAMPLEGKPNALEPPRVSPHALGAGHATRHELDPEARRARSRPQHAVEPSRPETPKQKAPTPRRPLPAYAPDAGLQPEPTQLPQPTPRADASAAAEERGGQRVVPNAFDTGLPDNPY